MIKASLLKELEIPYIESDTSAIALATDKSPAKKTWQYNHLSHILFIWQKQKKIVWKLKK